MNKKTVRTGAAVAAASLALSLTAIAAPAVADDDEYRILVVGETSGFRHSHIPLTIDALQSLGQEHGFTVDVWDSQNEGTLTENPFVSAENLSQYATIVFDSPVDGTRSTSPLSASLLSESDTAALKQYIAAGGGYFGVHAATDTMHNVPWYSQLSGGGAEFLGHPSQQEATMRVENPENSSTAHLPGAWERFDEWYSYTVNPRENVHVLVTLDESTYQPGERLAMGDDHPLSWCQNFGGGRSWYEGAGHTDDSWSDPLYLEHILRGLEWTAGVIEDAGGGNCVTFPEVKSIARDLVAGGELSGLLNEAQAAYTEKDFTTALAKVTEAKPLADAVGSARLSEKIDDLIEWQRAIGGADDREGVTLEANIEDTEGTLALSVAEYGDAVVLEAGDTTYDRTRFTAELPTVTVTDSRSNAQAGGSGWAATAQSTAFTSGDDMIGAEHLGWAPKILGDGHAGLAAGAEVASVLDGGAGLAASAVLASATDEGRRGSAEVGAALWLDAPVDAPTGSYHADLTLSLFPTD